VKVKYDDKEYDKITSLSRNYDYNCFNYIDENGSECAVYLSVDKSFEIIES
jgi:hypothetical protein